MPGGGGSWHIENFFEAMDEENEWYLDKDKATLYLIPNASHSGAAPSEDYVAVVLETLISINGTKAAPVRDIVVQGITFRDAADITMNPWGVRILSSVTQPIPSIRAGVYYHRSVGRVSDLCACLGALGGRLGLVPWRSNLC